MTIAGPLILSAVILLLASPALIRSGRRIEKHAPPPVAARAARARAGAASAARRPAAAVRHATVPRILAAAAAQEWIAARDYRRSSPTGAPGPEPGAPKPADTKRAASVPSASPARRMPPPPPPPARPDPATATPPAAAYPASYSTGAAGDLFAAVSTLIGQARAGGVRAKMAAISTLAEALDLFGGQTESWSAELYDEGKYAAPVWEPLLAAAAHMRAGSSRAGESAAALQALLASSVGDLAGTGRAPARDEINAG